MGLVGGMEVPPRDKRVGEQVGTLESQQRVRPVAREVAAQEGVEPRAPEVKDLPQAPAPVVAALGPEENNRRLARPRVF